MIYCDEFQRFSFQDFIAIIDEAGRKFGCPVTIAYQGLSQLDEASREAALRVGSLAVYRVSGPDADIFVKNFDRTSSKEPVGVEPVRAIVSDVIGHLVRHGHHDERVAHFSQYQLLNFEAFLHEHEPFAYHRRVHGGMLLIRPVDMRRGRALLNETFTHCMREQNPQVAIPPLALYLLAASQKNYCEWSMEDVVYSKGLFYPRSLDGFYQDAELFGKPSFVQPRTVASFLNAQRKKDKAYAQALVNLLTELRFCMEVLAREPPILEATSLYQPKYESIPSAEMERRIANALAQQPQFQARVRLASQGEYVIRAEPRPRRLTPAEINERIAYIQQRMLKLGYCKDVQEVARERAERLERLRQGIPVEPPPTHIKGNKQPALPPERKEEKFAALREKLIPIVRQALVRFEEQAKTVPYLPHLPCSGNIMKATECALVLRDKAAAARLLPQVMKSGDIENGARLMILLGDEAGAREILTGLLEEKRRKRIKAFQYHIALVAGELSEKTTAKRLMRELETEGLSWYAAVIAIRIGDKETIARIMGFQALSAENFTFHRI